MGEFFTENFSLDIPDAQWRLECLLKHQTKSYRKKKPMTDELFSKQHILSIDEQIRKAQITFEHYGLPAMSEEYFKNRPGLKDMDFSYVDKYIKGGRITGKVDLRFHNREFWEENGKSPRQYYAFNPFKYD